MLTKRKEEKPVGSGERTRLCLGGQGSRGDTPGHGAGRAQDDPSGLSVTAAGRGLCRRPGGPGDGHSAATHSGPAGRGDIPHRRRQGGGRDGQGSARGTSGR